MFATRSLIFWPKKHTAAAGLGPLADHDLDGVGSVAGRRGSSRSGEGRYW